MKRRLILVLSGFAFALSIACADGAEPHLRLKAQLRSATIRPGEDPGLSVQVECRDRETHEFSFGSVPQLFRIDILGPWGPIPEGPDEGSREARINWMHQEHSTAQRITLDRSHPFEREISLRDYFPIGTSDVFRPGRHWVHVKFYSVELGMKNPIDAGPIRLTVEPPAEAPAVVPRSGSFPPPSLEKRSANVDWTKRIQEMRINVDVERSSLKYSIAQCKAPFSVQSKPNDAPVTPRESPAVESRPPLLICFASDGRPVLSVGGHGNTVFVIHDRTAFVAGYSPSSSGCAVTGYSLETGKTLWTTRLAALGGVKHSAYSNHVNLSITDGALLVAARESFGEYVEVLDCATGRVLAQRSTRFDLKHSNAGAME